jgi:hypothetical protein
MKTKRIQFFPFIFLAVLLVMTPFLMAYAPALEAAPVVDSFFDGFTAAEIFLLIGAAIVGAVQGAFPKLSLFDLVKRIFKVEDQVANIVLWVFAGLLGLLALFVTGYFSNGISFTLEMLVALWGTIYAFSQKGFKWFKGLEKPDVSPVLEEGTPWAMPPEAMPDPLEPNVKEEKVVEGL